MNLILAAEKPAVEWRGSCRLHTALFPGKDRKVTRYAGWGYPNGHGVSVRDPRFAGFRDRKFTGRVDERICFGMSVVYPPADCFAKVNRPQKWKKYTDHEKITQ
jgi:hypothetical protein